MGLHDTDSRRQHCQDCVFAYAAHQLLFDINEMARARSIGTAADF